MKVNYLKELKMGKNSNLLIINTLENSLLIINTLPGSTKNSY
jgi:hypothetical protein